MTLRQLDRSLAHWMRTHGHSCMRFGLGIVFVWFGAPKLVPGLSPAEGLVAATVTCFDPQFFVPLLGVAEVLIGLCLMSRTWLRLGLLLMAGHMVGTALPLFTLPDVTWKAFPVATLEGQYILKNLVLVSGAIVLGGGAEPRCRNRAKSDSPPLHLVDAASEEARGRGLATAPARACRSLRAQ